MKRNRIFWAAWLLLVFVLYFFENNTGTRIVLAASILVPLFSAVCAAACAFRIRFEMDVPEKILQGQTAEGRCVPSGAALSAGCVIRAKLRISNCLTGGSSLISLDLEGDAPGAFVFPCENCGCLTLSLEDAAASDWFGLWNIPIANRAEAEVTVYPELYPVRIIDPEDPSRNSGDAYEQRRMAADPAAYGDVREYVPGDPVRRIHWKLSEKTDRLLIREDALSIEKRIRLVLSLGGGEINADRISETVGAFLSAGRSLCAEGYRHEACWQDGSEGGLISAEVGSESGFLSVQEAVLRIHTDTLPAGQAVPDDILPGDRILMFDAADGSRCMRDEPVLEL